MMEFIENVTKRWNYRGMILVVPNKKNIYLFISTDCVADMKQLQVETKGN